MQPCDHQADRCRDIPPRSMHTILHGQSESAEYSGIVPITRPFHQLQGNDAEAVKELEDGARVGWWGWARRLRLTTWLTSVALPACSSTPSASLGDMGKLPFAGGSRHDGSAAEWTRLSNGGRAAVAVYSVHQSTSTLQQGRRRRNEETKQDKNEIACLAHETAECHLLSP